MRSMWTSQANEVCVVPKPPERAARLLVGVHEHGLDGDVGDVVGADDGHAPARGDFRGF